jgi:hypothetical protein
LLAGRRILDNAIKTGDASQSGALDLDRSREEKLRPGVAITFDSALAEDP